MNDLPVYFAVDIGGTKIDLGLINSKGEILRRERIDTPRYPDDAVGYLKDALRLFYFSKPRDDPTQLYKPVIQAVGIGAPGIKGGTEGGYFGIAGNLPEWRNFPLRERLGDLELPVGIENDADAAAIGAFFFDDYGKRKRKDLVPFLYVTVSTGVGGGLVYREGRRYKLYRGHKGEHPEIGHIIFPGKTTGKTDIVCGCGRTDCLESYIGGVNIQKRYGVKPRDATEEIKGEVAENLAGGLYNICLLHHPAIISFGGGISNGWGMPFIEDVGRHLRAHSELSGIVTPPELRLCGLGTNTGLLGAAAVAIDAHKDIYD